jgi:hypothetical protein
MISFLASLSTSTCLIVTAVGRAVGWKGWSKLFGASLRPSFHQLEAGGGPDAGASLGVFACPDRHFYLAEYCLAGVGVRLLYSNSSTVIFSQHIL